MSTANVVVPGRVRAARRAEGWFYVGMAVAAMAITAAGFLPALIDPGSRRAPLTLAVAAHGAVYGSWLRLFLVQTVLVANGRVRIHRRLGYAGAGLAALMVVTGYATTVAMGRRGYDLSGDLTGGPNADPLGLMVFQLGDLVSFAVLISAGVLCRRRPEAHKRLMLLATVGALMPASVTHVIGHSAYLREIEAPIVVLPLAALLFANAVHDKLTRGRIHPVSLWAALAMLAWGNLRAAVIGPSDAWHRFAGWLVG